LSSLSKPELSAVRTLLQEEENLIFRFSACARDADDPQLRSLFEQIAARHRLHWNTLTKLLGMK